MGAPRRSATGWDREATVIGWGIVVVGVVLRARLWLADRSLWRDEAALVFNVLHRDLGGFAEPLAFEQGTPMGFFVLEHVVSTLLGPGERALRLVPLVASILTMVTALVLARRHLDPTAGLVAIALLAGSQGLLYFAAEVKQYSLDVLVTLVVWLAASIAVSRRIDTQASVALAVVGAVAVVLSHPAVFVLAGIGPVLAWGPLRRRDRGAVARLVAVGTVWAAAWLGVYLVSLRDLQGNPFLLAFWRDGFLAVPPTSTEELARWGGALRSLSDLLAGTASVWLVAPLAALGLARLARTAPGVLAAIGLPYLAVVSASALEAYPVVERMVLFMVPALAVLVGEGTASLVGWLRRLEPHLAVVPAVMVVAVGIAAGLGDAVDPPGVEELRPLLVELAARDEPGDAVYVSSVAVPAYDYYRDRLDLAPTTVVSGRAPIDDPAALAAELDPLDGRQRVWVVTAAFWRDEGHVAGSVAAALDRLGRPIGAWHATGASVHLYDLSVPPAAG